MTEDEERWQEDAAPAESPRVTPGLVAFVAVLLLPVVIGLGIVVGASAVAGEVYAARQQAVERQSSTGGFNVEAPAGEVAGWKRTLVGICPVH
jgi:hypothetical protein